MLRIINLSKSYNNQLILGDINLAVKMEKLLLLWVKVEAVNLHCLESSLD